MDQIEPPGTTNFEAETNYEIQYALAQETLDHFNKPKLNLLEGVDFEKDMVMQAMIFVVVFFAIIFLLRRWCK